MESECACKDGSIGGVSFLEFKQEPESAASYAHFSSMSANEVSKWLEEIGLGEYAAKFRENDVDGECLRIFSQQEGEALLKKIIPRIGPQIKFIYNLNKLVGLKRGKSTASSSDKDISGSIHTELLLGTGSTPPAADMSTIASNIQLGTGSTPPAAHMSTIASNIQLGTGSTPRAAHMSTIASNVQLGTGSTPQAADMYTITSNVQLGTEPTELLSPCIFNSASSDDSQLGPEISSPVCSTSDSNEAEPSNNQSVLSYQGSSRPSNIQLPGQDRVLRVNEFKKSVSTKEPKIMLHKIDKQSLNKKNGHAQSKTLELPSGQKKQKSVHAGKQTFSCDICKKSFFLSTVLKQHIHTHSGARPFTCNTCGNSFARAGTLKRYKRIHTGERPFMCNTCGKRFTRSHHLTDHKRLHSGEKPFHCTVCGKSFTRRTGLKDHKANTHKEENNNI